MKNFAVGHAFSVRELFMNFNLKRLEMTDELCRKLYSDGSKRDFAASIFIRSVEMVVDDIIENNVHFRLPNLGKSHGFLYMLRTCGEAFKRAFRRGKWRDVDFITSNFSGYLLALDVYTGYKPVKHKKVYLSAKDRDRITEHTNNGKLY